MKFIPLILATLTLSSCVTLTPADYTRIGEIVNDVISKHQPSGK